MRSLFELHEVWNQQAEARVAALHARREADIAARAAARRASKARMKDMADAETHREALRFWALGAEAIGELVYSSPTHVRLLAERLRNGLFHAGKSVVYFIGADRADAPVKIGTTVVLGKRLGEIQINTPETLRVLAVIPGDASIERVLHGVFARDRVRGEWFRRSPVIVDFIERLNRGPKPEQKKARRR
jgi:hypothetical protein